MELLVRDGFENVRFEDIFHSRGKYFCFVDVSDEAGNWHLTRPPGLFRIKRAIPAVARGGKR